MSLQTSGGTGTPAPSAWPELLNRLRGDTDPVLWRAAAARLRAEPDAAAGLGARAVSLALLSTATTDFYAELLPVAALKVGIDLALHRFPYGSVEQELIGPASTLSAARPDYVSLAGTPADLALPDPDGDPEAAVQTLVRRWTACWDHIRSGPGSRILQHTFTVPDEDPYGNLGCRVPGAPEWLTTEVNRELVRRAGDDVLILDCARLAAKNGRDSWFDPRAWAMLRMPVSARARPVLAAATAGALAADLGLTRRCIVVDLDNTLWGGVLGELGHTGVVLGEAGTGECFRRFQDYLLALRRRGIVLAVAGKNDAPLVDEAFSRVPGMRLRREHFAAVVADWRPKSQQIRQIAGQLRLGLSSLAFADDNPAECAEVLAALPEVDVIALPPHPAQYVRALTDRPTLAAAPPNSFDRQRAASYEALARAEAVRDPAAAMEEFLDSLDMSAAVARATSDDLPRRPADPAHR
ncbi:HAD-IIIC family phosphatase [Streptomyces sp. NPDC091371]|uniref:HAD-IIIC family phosphatase n=1 Tax=Streptomyces sp. NPDC091371 TaxID=3155303 RepID=UPI00344A5A20